MTESTPPRGAARSPKRIAVYGVTNGMTSGLKFETNLERLCLAVFSYKNPGHNPFLCDEIPAGHFTRADQFRAVTEINRQRE